MSKIDTTQWKIFKIYELFYTERVGNKIQTPTGASVRRIDLVEGDIPRITVSGINNGVVGYFGSACNNPNYRVFENFISVSFLGTVFYQSSKASLDMKVHCLKLVDGELNHYIGEYLVTCIKKSLKESRYSDQISSTILPLLRIRLPVDETGRPNFAYMESYMRHLESEVKFAFKKLQTGNDFVDIYNIEISKWREFRLKDIFKIKRPAARSQTTYREGETAFVASGNYNNGVLNYLLPKEGEILDKGNCISVSPIDGSAFYQPKDFLGRGGAGSSIILLYNDNLDLYSGTFIATIVRRVCGKYMYNDMANRDAISNEVIKLPVDDLGDPNYLFMSNYMKKLEYRVKTKIHNLKLIKNI